MKNILLSFIVFSCCYLESNDKFDVSKIYSFSDEIKIKSGHVFYCDESSYHGVKIDLLEEKFTYFMHSGKGEHYIREAPMADIENLKNILRFKVPPRGNEGPIDDISVWRRFYLDKINLRYSFRLFWIDKFLDPSEGDCSTEPPEYIKKLLD